jgi:hypothetical protein
MRYEDLDDTLKREPLWEPPAGFARAVVARALARNSPGRAIEYPVLDLLRGAELAVISAALAYAGTWTLWRLLPSVTEAIMANATPVAWTVAALSFLFAMWSTGDRRGWI